MTGSVLTWPPGQSLSGDWLQIRQGVLFGRPKSRSIIRQGVGNSTACRILAFIIVPGGQ